MKSVLSVLLFGSLSLNAQLPNLTPNPGVESLGVYIKTVNVAASDCAVANGVITPGKHKILVFAAGVYNIGDANLDLGDASTTAGFVTDACTGRFFYPGFIRFDLINAKGTVVATRDYAMCVKDFSVIPGFPPTASDEFTCAHQGITAGWRAFSMDNFTSGPFLLLDNVPSGTYTLRQTVNPENNIVESSYADNVYQFTVRVK
jgi:hypothetical protein